MKSYLKRFAAMLAVCAALTFIFYFGEVVVRPKVFYLIASAFMALFRK